MFGFGKKKPLTRDAFTDAANGIEQRIAQGDYVGAAQAAAALRKSVEANNGPNTTTWADAHFLEARTALALGDYPLALEHMRSASELTGDDEDTVKARLTNIMNLGDILSELGQLDEAEEVQRRALEERRAFYGEAHPGFGYGAESLGTVLLRKGQWDEAAELGKAAVAAFRGGEPHKLQSTLILWMLAEKSRAPGSKVLSLLSDEDRGNLVGGIATSPGYLFIDATVDLRWEVLEHLTDLDDRMSCLATIANHSQGLERPDDRIRALEAYVEAARESSPDDAAFALQGLALACDEAGRVQDAERAYEKALEVAEAQRPQVLRNFALYLAEREELDRAEAMFREAIDTADGEMYGRASGAYGVFLHHHERYAEAVPMLQACIDAMPANHPDRLTAEAHQLFARDGEACNCDVGMPVALSGFVLEVLSEYLPVELLDEVTVSRDYEISVSLTRKPSDDEVEAIQLATNEARRRIQQLHGA